LKQHDISSPPQKSEQGFTDSQVFGSVFFSISGHITKLKIVAKKPQNIWFRK